MRTSRLPIGMRTELGELRFFQDQVGTLVAILDGNENILTTLEHDSFGNRLGESDHRITPYLGFCSGLHDRDTNLVLFGYRNYDPDVGRFISPDPLGYTGGDPGDMYEYCVDDPVNEVDYTGLWGDNIRKLARSRIRTKNLMNELKPGQGYGIFDKSDEEFCVYNYAGEKVHCQESTSGPFNKGALPDGRYVLGREREPFRGEKTNEKPSMSDDFGNCFKFPLAGKETLEGEQGWKPKGRSGFNIHPDGNGRGTEGCIGLEGDTSLMRTWLNYYTGDVGFPGMKLPKVDKTFMIEVRE